MPPTTPFNTKRYVIVGNSAAAIHAVGAIRRVDPRGSITLIGSEKQHAYSPVLLTYYVAGRIDRPALFIADDDFYRRQGVELCLGIPAVDIDPRVHRVGLANGRQVAYDRLLIATGSSPKRLNIPGEELEGVFTLKTIADADRIVDHSEHMQRAVIIGGGLIGIQAANALRREGRQITKVIGSKQPLSRNVDSACAQIVCEGIRECGIELTFETSAVAIEKTGNGLRVRLDSGRSLPADAVLIGKGVRPNVAWLDGSSIGVDWGVVVDDTLRTNFEDIFAAGDVAQGTNFLSGQKEVIATWPNACGQGEAAGINMAGGDCRYQALSGNVCSFLGRAVASVGITRRPDEYHEELVHARPEREIYRKMIWNLDDQLVGAVLMGQVADIGILRALIRSRVRIPWSQKKAMVRGTVRYGNIFAKQAGSLQGR